jgi:hypothetical protein
MPEDEAKKLGQALVGLYKTVRLQSEAMAKLSAASEAYWPDGPVMSQALFASLPMLDIAISSLERDYGPWKN